ncbi:restriction endonuclease subunit S [Nocardiopsis akebiae]|uniref:Restriction endonuclease subunit S n=1 Tax=Nocardiopsis akebiae TaxID=2831968 RepID=A0ABX8C1I0_9ACTN|nr:restriction endonuclease subunit S [Nocardiopsis akebiae]QUX28226.1 restriction endonuclease subunit S [Nocardiopsis akebiae]
MDSLIGPLAVGWSEHRLGDLCEVQAGPSGASLPSREFGVQGTPLVRPGDIVDRRVSETGLARVADATGRLHRYRLRPGDVVGTRTGTLGRFARISSDQQDWLYSTQLLRVRPSARLDPVYLVHYLTLPVVQHWIDRHASGSTVRSLTVNTLRSLPTAVPPLGVQQAIGASLHALDDKARLHADISRTTSELHDALAPMLFSGRVPASATDM